MDDNTTINTINFNHNLPLQPLKTIAKLRSSTIAHPQQQVVLTCYIPPSRVGAVIGRKGNTILHIQREAVKKSLGGGHVRVSVVSNSHTSSGNTSTNSNTVNSNEGKEEGEDVKLESMEQQMKEEENVEHAVDSNTNTITNTSTEPEDEKNKNENINESALWTPVIIRGDPCGVFAAAKQILPLLKVGPPESFTTDSYDTSADMDDVVLDIPIHRAKHSAIIGKKGLTIAALSADHDVRIMVPHRNQQQQQQTEHGNHNSEAVSSTTISSSAPAVSNINIVQLEGQLDNVERCLANMLKVVTAPPPTRSPTRGAADTTATTTATTNATVDKSSANASTGDKSQINTGTTTTTTVAASATAESEKEAVSNKATESEKETPTFDKNTSNTKETTATTKITSTTPTSPTKSTAAPTLTQTDSDSSTPTTSKKNQITITTTSNHNPNSKKESKYLEQTITATPELYQFVPSLGKIRIIGKSTNTVIRRKRIDLSSVATEVAVTAFEVPDEQGQEQEQKEEGIESDQPPPASQEPPEKQPKQNLTNIETQLIVSGKTECVKNAVAQLEQIILYPNTKPNTNTGGSTTNTSTNPNKHTSAASSISSTTENDESNIEKGNKVSSSPSGGEENQKEQVGIDENGNPVVGVVPKQKKDNSFEGHTSTSRSYKNVGGKGRKGGRGGRGEGRGGRGRGRRGGGRGRGNMEGRGSEGRGSGRGGGGAEAGRREGSSSSSPIKEQE